MTRPISSSPEYDREYAKRVRQAVRLTLNEMGRLLRDDIRSSISIRVQRFGGFVIRSFPGEPPRYDTGKLWAHTKYEVKPKAATVEDLRVYNDDPKAPLLEGGTRRMEPRPFMGPAWRRWGGKAGLKRMFERIFPQKLAEVMKKRPIKIDVTIR